MNEWYQGFGDCQTLSGRFAVTPVWKGAFFDAFGYRYLSLLVCVSPDVLRAYLN